MTEQCMHDGKNGPCERPAVEAEHFCRRHLPKKAGPAKRGPLVQCDCATTGYEHTARCQNMQ